ncbi:hypothetical protein F8M41_005314 [Gigaspora margarita]|uniref:SbsA Ig-like domain-containing protein n=1 Tax=Gigaspora margarita TaxID=4874 RepID=A0A8H4ERL0_GIGMA|nr:hypothetical protein F8M41_005314 [Gigaspora margarita]
MMIANVAPNINYKVESSTNNISIHFSVPVFLSNGNITIYKASDNTLRKSVSANSEYCTLSNDGKVAYIRIVNGTFSEPGEKYYVRVGSNFVKTRSFNNEALRGIESNVWLLESVDLADKRDLLRYWLYIYVSMTCFTLPSLYFLVGVGTAATISVALTINASKRFLNSSLTNKSAYFDNLLDELANKIPVKRDRLSSDQKFQNFGNGQIVISFRIGPSNKAENTAQQRGLVTVLAILAVTDYEYLAILKNVPRFNETEIDFKYLTIMKDDPESVKAKTDYEYLKILKDELTPDEIKQIKQINMFRQIFRLTIIYGALFDIFLRNIPQIVIQVRIHYYIHL